MANYENTLKNRLKKIIKNMDKNNFTNNPEKNFTRKRKLDFEKTINLLLCMKDESTTNEICDFFNYSEKMPTSTAYRKQLDKIKSSAFEHIFNQFNKALKVKANFKGYRVLACDGSDLRIPRNPLDSKTFIKNSENEKGFNQLHINALYDLFGRTYVDILIQNATEKNEHSAFNSMVDKLTLPKKTIIIADRGYEGYNSFAHAIENGYKFLVRVKDVESTGILSGISLPNTNEFDKTVDIVLTRKHSNIIRENRKIYKYLSKQAKFDFLEDSDFYNMRLRIVRFPIPNSDKFEAVITNLPAKSFSSDDLCYLYHLRWGIETSFRKLKHSIGLSYLHAKKSGSIIKELWANAILYNFCESITTHIVISKSNTKLSYALNFSFAVKICRRFLKPFYGKAFINVKQLISKNLVPIRQNRHFNRNLKTIDFKSFIYRVA